MQPSLRKSAALMFVHLLLASARAEDVKVRVELIDIKCIHSEDVINGDEFYVTSALKSGSTVKTVVTTPIEKMKKGVTKNFPVDEVILFDASIPKDAEVVGAVLTFDEDYGKDWEAKDKEIAKRVQESTSNILDNTAGAPGKIASAVLGGVFTVVDILAQSDKDDHLGTLELKIPATGPALETKEFKFQGGTPPFTNFEYVMRYKIVRQ